MTRQALVPVANQPGAGVRTASMLWPSAGIARNLGFISRAVYGWLDPRRVGERLALSSVRHRFHLQADPAGRLAKTCAGPLARAGRGKAHSLSHRLSRLPVRLGVGFGGRVAGFVKGFCGGVGKVGACAFLWYTFVWFWRLCALSWGHCVGSGGGRWERNEPFLGTVPFVSVPARANLLQGGNPGLVDSCRSSEPEALIRSRRCPDPARRGLRGVPIRSRAGSVVRLAEKQPEQQDRPGARLVWACSAALHGIHSACPLVSAHPALAASGFEESPLPSIQSGERSLPPSTCRARRRGWVPMFARLVRTRGRPSERTWGGALRFATARCILHTEIERCASGRAGGLPTWQRCPRGLGVVCEPAGARSRPGLQNVSLRGFARPSHLRRGKGRCLPAGYECWALHPRSRELRRSSHAESRHSSCSPWSLSGGHRRSHGDPRLSPHCENRAGGDGHRAVPSSVAKLPYIVIPISSCISITVGAGGMLAAGVSARRPAASANQGHRAVALGPT